MIQWWKVYIVETFKININMDYSNEIKISQNAFLDQLHKVGNSLHDPKYQEFCLKLYLARKNQFPAMSHEEFRVYDSAVIQAGMDKGLPDPYVLAWERRNVDFTPHQRRDPFAQYGQIRSNESAKRPRDVDDAEPYDSYGKFCSDPSSMRLYKR